MSLSTCWERFNFTDVHILTTSKYVDMYYTHADIVHTRYARDSCIYTWLDVLTCICNCRSGYLQLSPNLSLTCWLFTRSSTAVRNASLLLAAPILPVERTQLTISNYAKSDSKLLTLPTWELSQLLLSVFAARWMKLRWVVLMRICICKPIHQIDNYVDALALCRDRLAYMRMLMNVIGVR